MPYRISCECADAVTVEDGAAGTTAQCRCGRTVAVPSLRELRRQSGSAEPSLSPEMVLEALLLAGKLPEEDRCVLCGEATDRSVQCRTACERACLHDGSPPWWARLLAFVSFGWIGLAVVMGTQRQTREWGKDRAFTLPLRVCDACRRHLTNPDAVRGALCRVPLYRQLLDKYPDATVSLLGS